jgi:signal transduction histidine kinase
VTWTPRRKLPLFLAVATLLPIGVLSWLAVRIVQQDRDVERQRARERLEVTAGRLALDIDRRFQDLEEQLARASAANAAGVTFRLSGFASAGAFKPLYQPIEATDDAVPSLYFDAAHAAEFQRRDLSDATAIYRRLAATPHPAARASALIGLARVQRQRGDQAGALTAYTDLQQLDRVMVAGQPAALIARQGRCKLHEESGAREELSRCARELAETLSAGGWRIDRATFDVYREMLERWNVPALAAGDRAKTDVAIEMWSEWRRGDLPPRGRRLVRAGQHSVLAVWSGGVDEANLWLGNPADLDALVGPLWRAQQLTVSMSDTEGQTFIGERQAGSLVLTPADTRLPFILAVGSAAAPEAGGDGMRRTVLISGLVMAFVLMLAAGYGLYRATTREMVLAREQADFVSAVSHEFRTPLTSMRHLTDLLVSRGVTSEERRTQYYGLLANETERLHRLVESLLSFGRIEGGAYAWQLTTADAGELVNGILEEFRRESLADGRAVVGDIEERLPAIRADREALSRAVWNLLENAAKYSEPGSEIRVFARRHGDTVLIGVGDRGVGIPPSEHEKIFQKFVRGAEAKRAGVRGVGIGLALVKRIVEAHGGTVRVESEPGRGSTFTLVLPCHEF